jgi:hypothetical protein
MKRLGLPILVGLAALAVTGCVPDDFATAPSATSAPTPKVVTEAKQLQPAADAGIRPPADPMAARYWVDLIQQRHFSARPDPFALQPRERAFESNQLMEKVFQDTGRSSIMFTPVEEVVVVPVVEPQPYRRLAGVIVGESIMALIDMGDGKLEIIRPGQTIQGWTVASIDAEKAVLRRGGNKLPHEVVVRLQGPINPGIQPGGGNSGGGRPGPGPGSGDPNGGGPGGGRDG